VDTETRELMRRAVKAPILEMEVGPPVCPHCQRVNPTVRTEQHDAMGPLFEYAVALYCMECENKFYGVPVEWSMHQDVSTLTYELEGRKSSGDGNQS
jgi:hypothetical protein